MNILDDEKLSSYRHAYITDKLCRGWETVFYVYLHIVNSLGDQKLSSYRQLHLIDKHHRGEESVFL